jgi:hypothetical protein
MVKTRLARFHYGGDRVESVFLLGVQMLEHRSHIIGQIAPRKQMPPVTAGNILDAAILFI